MQNQFAKKVWTSMLALCMAVAVSGGLTVLAGQENPSEKGYVVTFRPGEYGSFTQSYKDRLQSVYGSNNYRESETTGTIAIRVNAGQKLPQAPTINDITIGEEARQRYVVTNPASGYVGGIAHTDLDALAEYTLRVSSENAIFTVRHLDHETGEEIAPALKGTAPVGQTLVFYAMNDLQHYTPSAVSESIVLNADETQNILTFYYTADVNEVTKTEEIGGGTLIQYEDKTLIGGAEILDETAIETNAAASTDNPKPTEDVIDIPEEETPKTEFNQGDELIIPDEKTPKADFSETTKTSGYKVVIGGGFLILFLIIAGLIWVNRHNKKVDEI